MAGVLPFLPFGTASAFPPGPFGAPGMIPNAGMQYLGLDLRHGWNFEEYSVTARNNAGFSGKGR